MAAMGDELVLEVPHRDDPKVARLLSAKPADTHADYRLDHIEHLVGERFEVLGRLELAGATRTLFHLRPR